mmetsp:Transcript_18452/g.53896  ORF Transcript_18452/g.53896 Transcript_18452/m.53896 type:complete len:203 (-) Transcript_18452:75-683(-)
MQELPANTAGRRAALRAVGSAQVRRQWQPHADNGYRAARGELLLHKHQFLRAPRHVEWLLLHGGRCQHVQPRPRVRVPRVVASLLAHTRGARTLLQGPHARPGDDGLLAVLRRAAPAQPRRRHWQGHGCGPLCHRDSAGAAVADHRLQHGLGPTEARVVRPRGADSHGHRLGRAPHGHLHARGRGVQTGSLPAGLHPGPVPD